MKLKNFKKSSFYLLSVFIGIVLIISGIVLLINSLKGEMFEIIIKGILLFVWTGFTISNIFLYKKEKRKEETI
jgi:uncharacterized membrane protein HdeD (DUF308 family)